MRELHDPPQYVVDALTKAGGKNCYGEPNYRAVWGWNRLTLIGGEWEQDNADGKPAQYAMRTVPKYPQLNRWHIERWCPPEMYGTPFTWWGTTMERELGPYPARGEYEHVMVIEGKRGEFLQLNPTIVEHIARIIERSGGAKSTMTHKRNREAKKDDEYLRWADMVMDDNATWSYTPHTYLPANLKEKIA